MKNHTTCVACSVLYNISTDLHDCELALIVYVSIDSDITVQKLA